MAEKSTPESKTILSSTDGLITHLTANNPVNVADALLSAGLLTYGTYSKFLSTRYTPEMVAREITAAVTVKVKADPNNFEKFIDVLRSKGLVEAGKLLDDKFLDAAQDEQIRRKSCHIGDKERQYARQKYLSESAPSCDHYEVDIAKLSSEVSSGSVDDSLASSSSSDRHLSSEVFEDSDVELDSVAYKKTKRFPSIGDPIPLTFLMGIFKRVSKFWSLGTVLGVPYDKLDKMEGFQPEEQAIEVAKTCHKMDPCPTYEKLYYALRSPSVNDEKAANQVEKKCPDVSIGSIDLISPADEELDDSSFTEGNVLNAIEEVSDIKELGLLLGLKEATIKELDGYPVLHRKQKLVSRLFRIKHKCNWKTLHEAINQVKIDKGGEFNQRRKNLSEVAARDEYLSKVAEEDDATIRGKFGSLLMKIADKLEEVGPTKVRFFLQYLFKENISKLLKADSILDIFLNLREHKMWSYNSTARLKKLAKEFLNTDSAIMEGLGRYEECLLGHEKCLKIRECLSRKPAVDISKANPSHYQQSIRKEFKWKVFENEEILDKSLSYLNEVWENLPINFEKLDSVLHRIQEGCIEVVWYIPSLPAQTILNDIQLAVSFFKDISISEVCLEGANIYNATTGVPNEEECDEIRLLLAIQDKNIEKTQTFIKNSKLLNTSRTEMERTLLMIAAHGGCSEIVSILIKYGADVNQQDASGWTALAYAAVESEMDVINYLLENKANATIPSKNADCSNVLDLMNKLNKPDVHKFIMEQFFIKSAKRGDLIAMKKVMELSVDINATEKDEYAWNAFLYACNEGNGEIVDLLMKNGAHANATDVDGWSGLSLATRMGFLNIVKKLLENGADPNLVTKSFCSPLLFAAEENYAEIAKLLIKHGAKATICDTAGISPLTQACQLGHLEVVEALVENDEELDINKPTELGWPPLLLAAKDGYEKVVRFLVDHGADVTYIKKDETNVLHIASCKGHESITRYLCLQKKIDVDQTDMDGLTPLMFAACLGNYKLVRILVENGRANINVYETTNEWTAVFFAMQAGHLEVMKYLLNTKRVNLLHKDVEGNTLFELSENINSTAYEYLKENHVTEMERVERRDALTYAKIFKERKELYFEPMIRNIRAKCEIKAT